MKQELGRMAPVVTGVSAASQSATGRVAVGACGGSVVVIDDGVVVWQGAAVPRDVEAVISIDARRLVIVGLRGWLRVLDVDAGALSALVRVESEICNPTALAGGVAFTVLNTNRFAHLHAGTLQITAFALPGTFATYGPVRVGDDRILVWTTGDDGRRTWDARFCEHRWAVEAASDLPPPRQLEEDEPAHGSRYARIELASRTARPEVAVYDADQGELWRATIPRAGRRPPLWARWPAAVGWTGDGRHVLVRDPAAGVVVWTAEGREVLRRQLGGPDGRTAVMAHGDGALLSRPGGGLMRFDGVDLRATARAALWRIGHGTTTSRRDEVFAPDARGELMRMTQGGAVQEMRWREGCLALVYSHTIDVWDTNTGQRIARWTHGLSVAMRLAWNHDATLLAAGDIDGKLRLWTRTGALVRHWRGPTLDWIQDLAWHGDRLLVTDGNMGVVCVHTRTGVLRWLERGPDWRFGVWSPDGRRVALKDDWGRVIVRTIEHRVGPEAHLAKAPHALQNFAWWGDDRMLLSAGEGDAWSWRLGGEPERVPCPPGFVPGIGDDGRLEGFDATAGTLTTLDDQGAVQVRRVGPAVPAISYAWMEGGYAVADDRGAIHLIAGGAVRMTLRATVDGAAFSEVDGQVRWSTWQVPKGAVDRTVWGPPPRVGEPAD